MKSRFHAHVFEFLGFSRTCWFMDPSGGGLIIAQPRKKPNGGYSARGLVDLTGQDA